MDQAGTRNPSLIVLRGNSASGKSSVAAEIRARFRRGIAIVAQDNLRRVVLRERDVPGGANIELVSLVARHALNAGYHVIVEGIMYSAHYGHMLRQLRDAHPGPSWFYYFDVPFEETLRRHAAKPRAVEYGQAEMRDWYREKDLLPGGIERIITADSTLEETTRLIMRDAGLDQEGEATGQTERRSPRPPAGDETIWDSIERLHAHYGEVPPEIRLLKLSEEVGEAAEAFIGMTGMNSRKGVCRAQDDVLSELADVVITATVAMCGITGTTDGARDAFQRRLAAVLARIGRE